MILSGAAVGGCDSIDNLNLTVLSALSASLYDTLILGNSIQIGSNIYTSAGTYVDTLNGEYGCDSIIHLYLDIDTPILISLFDTICQGSFVMVGNLSYSQSGLYIDTLNNAIGDDSIITLNLTVNPTSSINLYDTLITGDTLYASGLAYTQSGVYTDTLTGVHGCDSIVTLYLYVSTPATFGHLFDTICQGFAVVLGGHAYTVSGTYIDTLTGTLGGDSIVTLNLTINQALLSHQADTICAGTSMQVGTHSYTQAGSYVDTFSSVAGCDSIVALSLVVNEALSTNFNDTISQGSSVSIGANTYSQAGSYIDTLSNAAGCDSIVILHLFVITGINQLSSISSVRIYPNPTQGSFTMDISAPNIGAKGATISVSDVVGQTILNLPISLKSGYNKELISLGQSAVSGVYIVQLIVDGESLYYKVVLDR